VAALADRGMGAVPIPTIAKSDLVISLYPAFMEQLQKSSEQSYRFGSKCDNSSYLERDG
jgi:hypothetical protein